MEIRKLLHEISQMAEQALACARKVRGGRSAGHSLSLNPFGRVGARSFGAGLIVWPTHPAESRRHGRVRYCQFSMTTPIISPSVKVNVTIGPSCTLSTKGGRKQARQMPPFCRTLGYTIPAEPLVNSLSPSDWEVV